eukprot:535355_1
MYCHNHRILPPCNILHDKYNETCGIAFFKDTIRKIPYIISFFAKFYALTTLINVPKWTRAIRKKQIGKFIIRIVKNLIGSSGFFLLTAISFRLPCFWTAIAKNSTNRSVVTNNAVFCNFV